MLAVKTYECASTVGIYRTVHIKCDVAGVSREPAAEEIRFSPS